MSVAALIPVGPSAVGQYIPAVERAKEYARNAKAESTRRAYATDWRAWAAWASANGVSVMPATPEAIAAHISDTAVRYTVGTIGRRLSSISQAHQAAGFDSPTTHQIVRNVFAGIKRELGVAYKQKAALVAKDLHAMVDALPDTLIGVRDRAILLFGFATAMRRSEIVNLNVDDLEFSEDGLVLTLRKSKTDQTGIGRKIAVPRLPHSDACPTRALRAWLDTANITEGPIFRACLSGGRLQSTRLSDRAVALVVKKRLPRGYDQTKYAAHSMRAGFCTAAAGGGASLHSIMATTGHRSASVAMRYIREANLFKSAALVKTGL